MKGGAELAAHQVLASERDDPVQPEVAGLREQARRYRRLARDVWDRKAAGALSQMAVECDELADALETAASDEAKPEGA